MARKLKDCDLSNSTARSRLKPRSKPYWRLLSAGHHVGYRRHRGKSSSGSWVARRYLGAQGYEEQSLGAADDFLPADGVRVLDFSQAQDRARGWFLRKEGIDEGLTEVQARPLTVERCMRDYLSWYRVHRKGYSHVRSTVEAHIIPAFGSREVAKLSPRQIRVWHESLALAPARLRRRRGEAPGQRHARTPEEQRKRKATANRVLSIFKAGLNRAFAEGLVPSDSAWRRVKPFRGVEEPKIDYLSLEEAAKLFECTESEPTFHLLVRAALLTGCRYSELVKFRVEDFHGEAQAVYVRDPKNGKPRYVFLNAQGATFFEELARGRQPQELIFLRPDGNQWVRTQQTRRMRKACDAAGIRQVSFHILRHTYGSQLAMQGVDLSVIAELLGHSDTRITKRHYAHLSPSYVASVVRSSLPELSS